MTAKLPSVLGTVFVVMSFVACHDAPTVAPVADDSVCQPQPGEYAPTGCSLPAPGTDTLSVWVVATVFDLGPTPGSSPVTRYSTDSTLRVVHFAPVHSARWVDG